jgi:hypothetical protein
MYKISKSEVLTEVHIITKAFYDMRECGLAESH